MNMSYGRRPGEEPDWASDLKVWIDGLAAERDVVLVAAAGNDGSIDIEFPASHSSVIGVAGSTPSGSAGMKTPTVAKPASAPPTSMAMFRSRPRL